MDIKREIELEHEILALELYKKDMALIIESYHKISILFLNLIEHISQLHEANKEKFERP